jgi:hypothetical protein
MTSTNEATSTTEMQSTREVERKYEAADEVPLPDPSRLLGAENVGAAEDQQLDAMYFDTPDLRLLRAGVTLRRREGGSDPGWHLKLPVGKDSREELQVPLGQAQRTRPAELTALTRVHTRGAEVGPVVRLCTRRRRWQLADDDGRPLAELVEDRVTAHTLGAWVGRHLAVVEVEPDPADQQPGGRRPPVRAVGGHRDLRPVHVDRVGPLVLRDAVEDPPQRRDALGADGELHPGQQRGPEDRAGRIGHLESSAVLRYPPCDHRAGCAARALQ